MDEDLAWLTQKTEEPKSNKRNFEVWSNKKVATAHPSFLHQPHPFQVYFPFSAENLVPPTPTPFNEVGCLQLSNTKKCLNLGNNWCVHVKEKEWFFKSD